ncbi:MAG: phosphoribosylaminoimidazolesuccinocarboxamide synthase [Fibrobacterota bacterium]
METPVISTDIKDFPLYKGKVRDVYDLGDKLLIIATDRISAFDCVIPNGIPGKGKILNKTALFWFDFFSELIPNHIITADISEYPEELHKYREQLEDRSVLVKKADRIDIECIVRGYITGSGWKDYKKTGKVCGIKLPEGLKESDKLPKVIFTPSTKAAEGHDENISEEEAAKITDPETIKTLKEISISVYEKARDYAAGKGIIIADTKFEFGVIDGRISLIDEILTPDSSRFWPADTYKPGGSQPSFDKQFVRDYLSSLDWDKTPPAPELPQDIIEKTVEKYNEAFNKLTGK